MTFMVVQNINIYSMFKYFLLSLLLFISPDFTGTLPDPGMDTSDMWLIEKIQKWLNPPDSSTNHTVAVSKCHPGTGSWLLSHWLKEKTILCSTIISDIQSIAKKGSIGLAYFYGDVSDHRKRILRNILPSLVLSLFSWFPPNQDILHTIHGHNGISRPTDNELQEILRSFISQFQATYIIINALDECLWQEWEEVLMFMKTVHGWCINGCHLLVTSRKEQPIFNSLVPVHSIEEDLSYMPIDADIKKYIEHVVENSTQLQKWNKSDSQLMKDTLFTKARGM
ncbi:hypothetical protein AX15_007787 [Amanita polypyramis BW_CC]|nr:hypothetical protein AX15_007787 [Amanita polypyramis BW_CC]